MHGPSDVMARLRAPRGHGRPRRSADVVLADKAYSSQRSATTGCGSAGEAADHRPSTARPTSTAAPSVLDRFPDRVFAFDEFGPLGIRPTAGSGWAEPGAANTLAALKSIRAARPDGAPIYVILDNLSAHRGADIRRWVGKNKVELRFTPTYASWANPIEAHFRPLRQFTIANSHHTVQTRALHAYLRWRNANARHRDVLAAERKERARIRSEKGIRWGRRPLKTAA